jgi:Flp pilus assembly protein protease CpaA
MYGGRKSLVFILLSFSAGTLLWISAAYFRRKRKQRAAINNTGSSKNEEKPRGRARRVPGKAAFDKYI